MNMKALKQVNARIFRSGFRLVQREAGSIEAIAYPGITPDWNTYASFLRACTNINSLHQIHAHIIISGLHQNIYLITKLVGLYAMWDSMENARQLFDKICERDVFLWNVMIRVYISNGLCEEALKLYYRMRRVGVQPDKFTFPFVLKACAGLSDLEGGKEIHDDAIRAGFESDIFVSSSVVAMYVKCGSLENARRVFDKISERNVVSWSAMIAGYAQNGQAHEALRLFYLMQLENIKPNSVTVASVLPVCADLGVLQHGKEFHDYIIKNGFLWDIDVGIGLVDMYAKRNSIESARLVFDQIQHRNIMLWNVMIRGYVVNGSYEEALVVYCEMQHANIHPDNFTFPFLLKACAGLLSLQGGRQIHCHIVKSGFEADSYVGNTLIAMYAKCRQINVAQQVFDNIPIKDVVSWSAMIAGYAQNGHSNEALLLFHQMQLTNVKANRVTFISALSACADLASIQQGKNIHNCIIENGFETDVMVGTALIDMYAKCGSLNIARQLFDTMSTKTTASWNAMIDGYGMHGRGGDALALFSEMQQAGVKPDHITFICVLSTCSHAGLVDVGWRYFDSMIEVYDMMPKEEHYACMVDLLGRAGRFHEAWSFIENMPLKPGASLWGSILSACKLHGNIELGEYAANRLLEVDPENAGRYVLLSNIYASADRWDDVTKMRMLIRKRRLKKIAGCSSIELNNKIDAFHIEDKLPLRCEKIWAKSASMAGKIKKSTECS